MPSSASGSWIDPTSSGTGGLGSTIGSKRGLPTSIRRFYDLANSYYIDTRNFFDQYGNPTKVRDGRGNDTTTAYADTYAFAYPTSSTSAVPDSGGTQGSSSAFTTTSTYDYNTGLTLTVTDANSLVTEYEYVDDLLRPTKVTNKSGGSQVGARTEMEYGVPSSGVYSSTQRFVKTKTQIDSTYWKESIAWADGLGRAFRSQEVKSGDDVYSVTCFNNMGRVQKTSNPVASSSAPTCASSLEWTTPAYDRIGRMVSTTTPDSAVAYMAYGLSTSTPIGTMVTATDQASKKRKSITDARGNLTRVVEDPDTLAHNTDYTYNVLKTLTGVSQGSQTRIFNYDAFSRLTGAVNPESGTVSYTYDANSNLATKTDARSITTTYTYDLLNRVKQRSYSDSTPTATYYYDNVTNAKGKLIKVSNSNSTTEYTSFDTLGRVTAHKQTPAGGSAYTTGYSYYLGGAVYEETYPSGRVVRNSLNTDGYLSQVETKPAGGSFTNRASNFTYTAAGAVSAMQLGNSLWESTVFNNRLQPTAIKLGTTSGNTDRLSLTYGYGSTNNNGNVLTQTISVQSAFTADQTYTYDALNRIATASESISGSQTWSQTYGYDQYGNRNITAGTGATSLTFGSTTNRITTSGYSYDSTGNTTADPSGKSFTYDAENKQLSVTNGGTLGNYAYAGDGKRVKKYNTSNSDNIIFVYDAAGKLIEERDPSNYLQTSYVYVGSRLLSTETGSGTSYLTADHLGSQRINTNGSGSITARHDYMPFGEEIFVSLTSQRSSGAGYSGDSVRKQFTGYERDTESGFDFAQNRMYQSSTGRFTSTDPIFMQIEMLVDPQRFNLYGYVRNNPLRFTDPDGLKLRVATDGNPQQAILDLKTLVGDLAEFLMFDPIKDKEGKIVAYDVSFKVTAKQIGENEGARLIFDLVSSEQTFMAQRGGTVDRKFKGGKKQGQIEKVDVNKDGGGNITRNRPGQTGIFEPVDPSIDSIIYYPDYVVFVTIDGGLDVPPIRTFIHEAAESYLLAQGIEYQTAHGMYQHTKGEGKKAVVTSFAVDPRNAISREAAIANQLKLGGGASGSSREESKPDLKKKNPK